MKLYNVLCAVIGWKGLNTITFGVGLVIIIFGALTVSTLLLIKYNLFKIFFIIKLYKHSRNIFISRNIFFNF
jgi:hypothetical protein